MPQALILLTAALLLPATPALAYVGPGSSLGAVGFVLGLIGTLFLTLVSFIWYPIRRVIRRQRRAVRAKAPRGR